MAAALLTSGCGKFVRDELITMQNEMDQLYDQIKLMNDGLSSLQEIVRQMAAEGYIIKHEAFEEEDVKDTSFISAASMLKGMSMTAKPSSFSAVWTARTARMPSRS